MIYYDVCLLIANPRLLIFCTLHTYITMNEEQEGLLKNCAFFEGEGHQVDLFKDCKYNIPIHPRFLHPLVDFVGFGSYQSNGDSGERFQLLHE